MEDIPQEAVLEIKVIPKAAKTEIVGFEDGCLRVRVNAVPEKGKANAELIAFLSKKLKIAKSRIEVIRGGGARRKTVRITGMTTNKIIEIINN